MSYFSRAFNLKIPERLETDRLYIRPFENKDWEPFFSFMRDEVATQYLSFIKEQKTYQGAEELFHLILERYGKENQIFVLAVIRKSDDQYVGAVGLLPVEGGTDAEVFYSLIPKYWGKGYATEATHRLFAYVFSESDINRIVASIYPMNKASEKVAKRVGMIYKGFVMRELQGSKVKLYIIKREDFFSRG
ncbi:MAG: GNAT family N-acetyltransferase [Candidatus Aminicenantes bacterium]|nr:GNAT family N-acetyltransferase [Candidatus Aminicenantes bacterium]